MTGPRVLLMAALLGLANASAALAASPTAVPATPAPAPPPVSAEPANTSATYGDWVMRCQRVGDGTAARRMCEVAQTIRVQQGRDPIAEVALGRLPVEKALHLTALLPPNVSFPSSVSMTGEKPAQTLDLQWRRCLPGGCFADAVAADDLIKAWRGTAGTGKLTFKDAGGRDIQLPVSFRGLAQALDALDKA